MSRIVLCAFAAVLLSASFASAQVATGVPPFSSVVGGPDAINPGNLNAHWDFPLYQRGGRGMPFSYVMSYDSTVYAPVTTGTTTSWQPVANFGWRGQSEALTGYVHFHASQGQCRGPSNPDGTFSFGFYTIYNFDGYQDGAGVLHPIHLTTVDGSGSEICTSPVDSASSASGTVSDGSGYTLSVTNFTDVVVTSRGGITIHAPFSQNGSGSIVDTNGNVLTTTVNTSNNTTTFTDTLGSTALTVAGAPPQVTYSYTDPNGNPAAVTMNYTQFTVATNFGVSGIGEYKATTPTYLVTSIDLPNGTSYGFSYEPTPSSPAAGACAGCVTGRIASVTLPTGGAISYTYTGGNNGMATDGATSGFDRTTPDGTWHYVRNGALTVITDPKGNETMYEFWSGIYESSRRYYQGKGSDGTGKLLAEIDTCWNGSCTSGAITLPITQRSMTLTYPDGVKSKTVSFFNNLGLPTESDEYDFPDGGASSPPKRKKLITYDATLGSIKDRPHQVTVEDGAATPNIDSHATYTYDEAGYCCSSPAGATPQHIAVSGSRGNPTTITSQASSGATISKHISYYDTGMVKSAYDAKGNIVSTANFPDATSTCGNSFPASVTASGGLTTSTVWNCSCGIPVTTTDPNNQVTKLQYDSMYRLTQVTRPDQTTLTTQFNDSVPPVVTQSSSANSAETVMNLDGLSRVTSKILENAGTPVSTVEIRYDSLGRPYQTSNPYSGSETPLFTTTSYDALGRPLSITPPSAAAQSSATSITRLLSPIRQASSAAATAMGWDD